MEKKYEKGWQNILPNLWRGKLKLREMGPGTQGHIAKKQVHGLDRIQTHVVLREPHAPLIVPKPTFLT